MSVIQTSLKSLVIFRSLLKNPTVEAFLAVDEAKAPTEQLSAYCEFAARVLANGGNFSRILFDAMCEDENIYTRYRVTGAGEADLLEPLLTRELELLSRLADEDGAAWRRTLGDPTLAKWHTEPLDIPALYRARMETIRQCGFGIWARYHMFVLDEEGHPTPIRHPDTQRLEDLVGYEAERARVLENTRAFLAGKPANNVLLYGDAGTGKSSTVKAIANELYGEGLRLIELKKNQLYKIPLLLDTLSDNPLRFILFIDDLTFTSDDRDFCALKAILEGGVSARGQNVLIYATSNHRHMIKELLSDREGDEVHVADKMQEMVSLSARFGLTVTFSRPDKALYARIVESLAKDAGIQMDAATLITRAEAFALRAGGRNPRTAKQFIDSLAGSEALN